MKTLRTLLLFAALVVILNSCATEEELPEKTKLLTSKTWTFESLSGFDDFSAAILEALYTGATLKFNSDGTVVFTILGLPNNRNWEFNEDQTVITFDAGTADEGILVIVTLSETTFSFRDETSGPSDGVVTFK